MTDTYKWKTIKQNKTKIKYATFINALINTFGEGAIVTRTQICEVFDANSDKYANFQYFTKNHEYKVGRNKWIIATRKNLEKLKKAYHDTENAKLPAKVKANPLKLFAALEAFEDTYSGVDADFDNNDIKDIMKML